MNLLDMLGKFGIRIDLSGMFSVPPAPAPSPPSTESPAIAAVNADVQAALETRSP